MTSVPAANQAPSTYSKDQTQRSSIGLWLSAFLFTLFLLPLLAVLVAVIYFQSFQIILPGVKSGALPLGTYTVEDAAVQIDQFWNQTANFVVTDGEHTWTVTPPNVGLWIDPGETAQRAFELGRGNGGLADLQRVIQDGEIQIDPVVTFNDQVATDVFTQLAASLDIPAEEAQLVQNVDGHWQALPGKDGYGLDVAAAVDLIAKDPQAVLDSGYLMLPMRAISPAVTDLSGEVSRIEQYYQRPLKLMAYDAITNETLEWQLPQEMVAGWLHLDDPYAEPTLKVDDEAFQTYLGEWQQTIGNREIESMDALDTIDDAWVSDSTFTILLRHKPTQYTVQAGDNLVRIGFKVGMPYWKIQEANPGIGIYGVSAGQVLTIPSKNEMLPLPVVLGKRIVISITEQHMWVYENGELRSEHVISTGMSNSPTLPGIFQIQTHEINAYASNWDLWMPNFMGIYEAVPGFMNGIHGLPLLSSGVRLWGNVLGRPASYGCIILDLAAGEDIYNWAEDGVVVEIQP